MKKLHACLTGLVLILVLFIAASPGPTSAVSVESTATAANSALNVTTSGIKSLWHSWYGKATSLLDAAQAHPSIGATAPEVKEARVVGEIKLLAEALRREEAKLEDLLEARLIIKRQSWTWFLDPQIRAQVDTATLAVNNQRRKVESLFDDISLHWRQLKPLHGVRSRMFASELLAFLLAPVLSILDFLASTFSFGLLFFFLLLGPVALFFSMFAFSLGMAMLPMIGSCLVILYTLEFPWLIIQYNPSALEFVVAYAPFLLATYWLAKSMSRTLRPVRQFRYYAVDTGEQHSGRQTTHQAGAPAPSSTTTAAAPRRTDNVKTD
jgi:hypothetical protein